MAIPAPRPTVHSASGEEAAKPSPEKAPAVAQYKKHELVRTVKTPEAMAEKVDVSKQTLGTLVATVSSHFEQLTGLTAAERAAITSGRKEFFEAFLKESQIDITKDDWKDSLEQHARQFLEKGGLQVRMAQKLAEWEAATLQRASQREFHQVKRKKGEKPKREQKMHMELGPEGFREVPVEKNTWQQIGEKWSDLWSVRESIPIYELRGGQQFNMTVLNTEQKKFMQDNRWQQGAISDTDRAQLDARLKAIAQARSELYINTGFDHKKLRLNFTQAGVYLPTKAAHFLDEVSGSLAGTLTILEQEGRNVAGKIKTKVQEEITKRQDKEKAEKADQSIVRQLEEEIKKITEEETNLSPEEVTSRKGEIEEKIRTLRTDMQAILDKRSIDHEISEAQQKVDEAKDTFDKHQVQLQTDNSRPDIDLVKWNSGLTEPESVAKKKEEYTIINGKFEDKKALLKSLEEDLKIQMGIKEKRDISGGTGKPVIEETYSASTQARIDLLNTQIDDLRKGLWIDDGSGQSLAVKARNAEAEYQFRETILKEEKSQELLKALDKANDTLQKKQDRKTEAEAEVTALTTASGLSEDDTLQQIKDNIKKNEEELKEVGSLTGEAKVQTESLEALKGVFGSSNRADREERVRQAEMDSLGIESYDLEYASSWDAYPKAVLRAVQLIWGDDVLQPHPENPDLADNIRTLLQSQKYLSYILGSIFQETYHIVFAVGGMGPANIENGMYKDMGLLFPDLTTYDAMVPVARIDRKIIERTIEYFRVNSISISVR